MTAEYLLAVAMFCQDPAFPSLQRKCVQKILMCIPRVEGYTRVTDCIKEYK